MIIYIKKLNIFQIWEIRDYDLSSLIYRIDKGEDPIKMYNEEESKMFKNIRRIKWSPESNFLVCYGYEEISIVDFREDSDTKFGIVERFTIYMNEEDY